MLKTKIILGIYLLILIQNLIIDTFDILNFGKDGSLLFRIFFILLISVVYFVFRGDKILKDFIFGFIIGIVSFIITYVLYYFLSFLIFGDNRNFDISLIYDQIIAISIVFLLHFFYSPRASSAKGSN